MARPSRSSDGPGHRPEPDKVPTIEDFLETVARSGLLDRTQALSALENVPPAQKDDSRALADQLVRSGKLSRFQARKLLLGVSKGLIFGPYQILSLIGRGGMGKVFLARDSRNGELRALKVLPPSKARSKDRLLARFQREMELSQIVAHPHLCRTYEVGKMYGVYYLAMEFIPGQTLSRLVGAEGPLTVARTARLMAEVAAGLEHAHLQGLIHRDLKPGNIMITPHEHAKVLDLGLALMEGEPADDPSITGGQGYVVGTMDYIAPEQTYDATAVDARADVYSLGCTLYFALTGQPPFPGGTSIEKIYRHRKDEPEPLRKLRPEVPVGFAMLVEQMMAKKPEHRLASAGEAEAKLLLWAEGSPQQVLDSDHDPDYVAAIEALRKQEPSPDSTWTDIDLGSDTSETPTNGQAGMEEGFTSTQVLVWGLILLGFAVAGAALVGGLVRLVQTMGGG